MNPWAHDHHVSCDHVKWEHIDLGLSFHLVYFFEKIS